jgi:Zn finger protein HypA/HybF involved in hydrogenase expression
VISVSLTSILAYLMIVPLTVIMILWLYDSEKKYSRKAVPTRKVMCECEICLFHFTADKADKYVRCPRCKSLMERKVMRRRKGN